MRRDRILLMRSGRHLGIALDALRARFPDCEVGVVGTPGSEAAVAQAGIAPADYFLYPAPRVQPVAFRLSATACAARRWGYDRVAILWNDPAGTGQGNVDRTAMIMSPAGYLAITPDGTVLERSSWRLAARESLRAVASLSIGAALGCLLFGPARAGLYLRNVASGFNRTRPVP
jgi:hypothetical protein